jgi:hypothetical protein
MGLAMTENRPACWGHAGACGTAGTLSRPVACTNLVPYGSPRIHSSGPDLQSHSAHPLVGRLAGTEAVQLSHADYRKLFKAPVGYINKTQYPQVRERTRREYDLGYDKHPSPRHQAISV